MKRCDAMQKAVAEHDAKLVRQSKCFWTFPFGHCYHWIDTRRTALGMGWPESICCHCGHKGGAPPEGAPIEPMKEAPDGER